MTALSIPPKRSRKPLNSPIELEIPKQTKEYLTPETALNQYSFLLSELERKEIQRFPKVYFLGNNQKTLIENYSTPLGDYIANIGDHIAFRYEIKKNIDSGTFGVVLHCIDHKVKKEVAIKVLKRAHTSKKQGINEFKIADLLANNEKDHTSIIKALKKFDYRFHSFIVFELLSVNLYEFMKLNQFKPMNIGLVKRITVQLLTGLNHIHSNRIIHCDMKPENILFKHPTKSSIRIIDFGNSCFFDQKLFTYIQSRIYRAPEVILQCGYNEKIDI